jgi:hypothetical protein
MMKHAFRIALITLFVGCVSSSEETLGTSEQESQTNFANMVRQTIGILPGLSLLGYGCYCGLGNEVGVIPVDATDSCCLTHDHAWMAAGDVAAGCDCNTVDYTYTNAGGAITCTAGQSACATYCCEADKEFAQCVAASPPGANTRYDRSQCEPIECVEDEQCEGGTWCNDYRCVPYCGGGFSRSAVACDVVEETTTVSDAP